MNPLTILSLVSALTQLSASPSIQSLLRGGVAGVTPAKISAALPDMEPLFAGIGAMISPAAEAGVHAVIGFTSAMLSDTPVGKKVQVALNAFLANTPGFVPLVVDGRLGAKTGNAIVMAQTKAGIKVDGWFGKATAAAIGLVLS